MSAITTHQAANGRLYTITAVPVTGLDLKPYIEYRLEERDELGNFVGYCAMGSREFVTEALDKRIAQEA